MVKMVVRITLTILLLVVVWMNAHWSVALMLTLFSAKSELEGVLEGMREEEHGKV